MTYKYYDQKLGYIMADMLIYGYDFHSLKEPLKTVIEKKQQINSYELEIEIKCVGPNKESPLLQCFYS